MKTNKYCYLYVLQGNYGYGFEDLTAEDKSEHGAYSRIRQNLKEYRENEGKYCGASYRIISRRELNV